VTLIAHVSDTHFGTELLPVCAALRTDLLHHSPDLVVLTGDITQRARSAQFRAARAFMDSLRPIPVLALPGNHDLPLFDLLTRFTQPYRLYRSFISPELAPAWQNSAVVVIGVNTTRAMRHKNGELPAEVVREVAKRLARVIQPFKIVALHHPLAVVQPSDRPNRARGAEAALAAWTEAGADLFLGGHIHLPYCITVEPGPRRAVLLQAGTGVSWRRRDRQPNSYNLIRLEDDCRRMRLEQRDYDDLTEVFAAKVTWEATRAAAGWGILLAR
jgi:predicted MPP superfamily phosphohydrolase